MSMKIMETKNVVRLSFALFVTLLMVGCENKPASNSTSSPTATPTPQAAKSGATGSITANPNPVQVCDGSGFGITTVSWTFSGARRVEVHVGAPNGVTLALAEAPGTQSTGKWVGNGTTFYLQDVSNGLPATADYTIASVTANVTNQGCP